MIHLFLPVCFIFLINKYNTLNSVLGDRFFRFSTIMLCFPFLFVLLSFYTVKHSSWLPGVSCVRLLSNDITYQRNLLLSFIVDVSAHYVPRLQETMERPRRSLDKGIMGNLDGCKWILLMVQVTAVIVFMLSVSRLSSGLTAEHISTTLSVGKCAALG